jgi:hypothetical protein
MWPAKNASRSLQNAFAQPFPEDASILKISARASRDITLEAELLAYSNDCSITRAQLKDGSVVMLFVPKKTKEPDTPK